MTSKWDGVPHKTVGKVLSIRHIYHTSTLISIIYIFFFLSFCPGYIYIEPRRSGNALVHMEQAYDVYKSWSSERKYAPHESVLKMRQFLYLIKVSLPEPRTGICLKKISSSNIVLDLHSVDILSSKIKSADMSSESGEFCVFP